MPDLQQRFHEKYGDRGLLVAAVDPNGDDPAGVRDFVKNSGATYPIGLEDPSTPTYKALIQNYRGLNPYPLDVVVGRDGKVVYVGREYDPAAMTAAVEAALAD